MKLHFNLIAPFYEKVIGLNSKTDWRALLEIKQVGVLLDAGAGTGRVSKIIQKLHPEMKIILADESAGMLKEAMKSGSFSAVLCQTENLPFKMGTFSRIVMVDALHHVKSHRGTVNELWRVLGDEGMGVIEEPDIDQLPVKLLAIGEKLLLMRSMFLSSHSIKKLLPNSAIIDVQFSNANFWLRFRKNQSV